MRMRTLKVNAWTREKMPFIKLISWSELTPNSIWTRCTIDMNSMSNTRAKKKTVSRMTLVMLAMTSQCNKSYHQHVIQSFGKYALRKTSRRSPAWPYWIRVLTSHVVDSHFPFSLSQALTLQRVTSSWKLLRKSMWSKHVQTCTLSSTPSSFSPLSKWPLSIRMTKLKTTKCANTGGSE